MIAPYAGVALSLAEQGKTRHFAFAKTNSVGLLYGRSSNDVDWGAPSELEEVAPDLIADASSLAVDAAGLPHVAFAR